MRFKKYTKEQFIEAIASSRSIAQALVKLQVSPHGGNYRVAKSYIKKLNLDTSHMSGQAWLKNNIIGPKRPIEDYLNNKKSISSHELRKRLIKESIKQNICESCKLTHWLNKPIPLELHHIDGEHTNNNLTNLQLLCPNCHSLTDNFRNKKKK